MREDATECTGGSCSEGSLPPEGHCAAAGTNPKGRLAERELVELRRLLETDERFGRALEAACHAVYEAMAAGNPAPVLALLADLVWKSLRISWELEAACGSSRAELRARVLRLESELSRATADLQSARSAYFRELVALRDQIRRLKGKSAAGITDLVYLEEPVMYYEPLQYLPEDVRQHVCEIVEEKMQLLFVRLQWRGLDGGSAPPPPGDPGNGAKGPMARDALALAESRNVELEVLLAKARSQSRAAAARYEAELAAILEAAKRDSEALAQLAELCGCRPPLPPPPSLAGDAESGSSLTLSRSLLPSERSGLGSCRSEPADQITSVMQSARSVSAYVEDLLRAGAEMRQSLWEDLLRERPAADSASAVLSGTAGAQLSRRDSASTVMPPCDLESSAGCARSPRDQPGPALNMDSACTSLSYSTCGEAERTCLPQRQVAELSLELDRQQVGGPSNPVALQAAEREELGHMRVEVQRLRRETQRLSAIIEELSGKAQVAKPRARELPLNWKRPMQQVFDRLFQDAIDRDGRRALAAERAAARTHQEPVSKVSWSDFLGDSQLDSSDKLSPRFSMAKSASCAGSAKDVDLLEDRDDELDSCVGLVTMNSVSEASADGLAELAAKLSVIVPGGGFRNPQLEATKPHGCLGTIIHQGSCRPPPAPPTSPAASSPVTPIRPCGREPLDMATPPAIDSCGPTSEPAPPLSECCRAGPRLSGVQPQRIRPLSAGSPAGGLVPVGTASAAELQRLPEAGLSMMRRPASMACLPARCRPLTPAGREGTATGVGPAGRAGPPGNLRAALPVIPKVRPLSRGRGRLPEAGPIGETQQRLRPASARAGSLEAAGRSAPGPRRRPASALDLRRGSLACPQPAQLDSSHQQRPAGSRG